MDDSEITRLLKAARPYPGAPRFFKRVWDRGNEQMITFGQGGQMEVTQLGPPGVMLTIYGFACRSDIPEDARPERLAWERRQSFYAFCISEKDPTGEFGFVPASEVEEIERAEFIEFMKTLGKEIG